MTEERLASLREKIEGVDEFLRGEVAACRRNSKIVGIVGIIVAVVIAIYFGVIYFGYFKPFYNDAEGFLEPDKLVGTLAIEVEARIPDILKAGEKLLLENSAALIEDGKSRLLEELPAGRERLEEYLLAEGPGLIEEQKAVILKQLPAIRGRAERYVEENTDRLVSESEKALLKQIPKLRLAIERQIGEYAAALFMEISRHIDEIAPEVIERNREEILEAFEKLSDPEAVVQLKEDFKALFNQMIDEQVGKELDTYVEILKDINDKLAKLLKPELTEEQRVERDFIANLKELMFRKFEALREEPAIEITPPEEKLSEVAE